MKKAVITVFLGAAAFLLAACNEPATKTPNTSTPTAAAPTKEALFALDKQANEAYLKGDSKFFEEILSDKLVMHEGGQRMDKAAVVKQIAGNRCQAKDWKLEEPQMARIDPDTYVLSYKGMFDGSCTGADGKPMKIPSPTRAATVWVRSGEKWLAAYHGENLIIDPKAPRPAKARGKKEEPKQHAADAVATAAPADPGLTDAMMEVEKKVWEAWMAKDARKLEDLTAKDLSFQNIFGTSFATKAETIKDWTGPTCDVTSVNVAAGAATLISPTVGILTSKGTAEGACGGQKPAKIRVYGTSVYVKDGAAWKLAFTLNRPLE